MGVGGVQIHGFYRSDWGWDFFGGAGKWGLYRFLSVGLGFGQIGASCRDLDVEFGVGTRALAYSGL